VIPLKGYMNKISESLDNLVWKSVINLLHKSNYDSVDEVVHKKVSNLVYYIVWSSVDKSVRNGVNLSVRRKYNEK
jgi:hypothetical protein